VSESELSPGLRELIDQYLGTIDEIEVLLWVFGRQGERHSAAAIAAGLHKPEESVRQQLQQLATNGFLVQHETEGTYSYSVGTPGVTDAIEELARLYEERPVTLINALYERSSTSVRSFADAFRIRKD
jgi:predicted ArsR family transcriptional regulator